MTPIIDPCARDTPDFTHFSSAYAGAKLPHLSVLIPYYKDDALTLVQTLAAQIEALPEPNVHDVEIIIYDDGSQMPSLSDPLSNYVRSVRIPVRLICASGNRGRSYARNHLCTQARAEWVLFLDADMLPQTPTFITDYLDRVRHGQADIIFGGFTVSTGDVSPSMRLHHALSLASDCLSVDERQAGGPKHVASSNLCVRKSVLVDHPFDPEFNGWGWEDSEWAARVNTHYNLVHADIPAVHLGLETTETLLRRFQTSGPNYVRFTRAHPELAKNLPLFRIVKTLQKIPGHKILRPVLHRIIRLRRAPLSLRIRALKLWRASWYTEAFE